MNLVDIITDAIWEGFEDADNACVDREMDLIDTGGNYDSFSMKQVAEHVIERLGLVVETRPLKGCWGNFENLPGPSAGFLEGTTGKVSRVIGKWDHDPSYKQA